VKVILLLLLTLSCAGAATVRVQVAGKVTEIELERYVAGVLGGEASVFRSSEALKAMAVAARTYAVHFHGRHAAEGFDLCDKTHCQRVDLKSVTARLIAAVSATAGQLLTYQGKPALTYYHRDCGGRTEDVRAVWPEESAAYLASHADPYCVKRPGSGWNWSAAGRELVDALQQAGLRVPRTVERAMITEKSKSGRAQTVLLSGGAESIRVSASSLRFAVGRVFGFNRIPSDQYHLGTAGNRIVFDGVGSGHGVGLCQNGAEQMGLDGHTYSEILAFYYPGAAVQVEWRRVTGERIVLFVTQPDAGLLATAERLLRAAERRLQMTATGPIEIRAYPDVAAFRDSTGEPGWVAARTNGRKIELQPAGILRSRGVLDSTLTHELTHVLIEERAKVPLPAWFREGLAAHLSGSGGAPGILAPQDNDLRQRAEQDRARAANEAARARVAGLVARYGEGTVVGWLRLGLPREVTNASSNQAPTKSK